MIRCGWLGSVSDAVNFIQHTHPSNAVAVIKRLKNLSRTEPRDCMNLTIEKPKVTAGRRPPDRRTIFKDREDESVVTAKLHRGVSIHSIYVNFVLQTYCN